MKKYTFLVLSFFLLINAFALDNKPDAIVGIWLTGEKSGHVEIFKKGDKYYGKLAWIKEPTNADGSEKKDINNPKENLRSRPIKGLVILREFSFEGQNVWEDGKIYDPQSGSDYSCKMTLKNNNTLEVRGYIGLSVFGRTDTWTRVK